MPPAVYRPAGWLALLLSGTTPSLPAQVAVDPDPPPIEFLGFRPGATMNDLSIRAGRLGGSLRCKRANKDRSVFECRTWVHDPVSGRPVELWASVIDGFTGVLTLAGPVTAQELDDWRTQLQRFGEVDATVQGSQWMMQWVRKGRMIRLTWRIKGTEKLASVSLVDGHVLDAWGRRRAQAAVPKPGAPAGTGAPKQDSLP